MPKARKKLQLQTQSSGHDGAVRDQSAVTEPHNNQPASAERQRSPVSTSESVQKYESVQDPTTSADSLESKLASFVPFSSSCIEGNDAKCMMLTGLKWDTFQNLFLYLVKFTKTKPDSLPARDQLLITLVKLRHHLSSFDLLADIRKIPKSTTIDILDGWI